MGVISNGTTLLDSGSLSSGLTGSMTLLSTQTASSSANISFTSVIDSTYKEYIIKFINVHAATDDVTFQVNFRDGSTAYDATKTTTAFFAVHNEADDDTDLEYYAANDQGQGTAFQRLGITINNSNDNSTSGFLRLFNPSSTTFVKHFIATSQEIIDDSYSMQQYTAGYFNTTSAIDEIQFKMSSGNIDAGTIQLIGIT